MPESTCGNPECTLVRAPKPPTGPQSPYCSRRCRTRADYLRRRESALAAGREATACGRVEKVCAHCGAPFMPAKTNKQRFCSTGCGQRYANAAWRSTRGMCANPECGNKAISRGLCRQHHPAAGGWSNGNPETRRANLRRKTQQRRARLKGDSAPESIDRDDIGRRDAWRCGLCAKRVDASLPHPHPLSASLDHIEPLSLGGRHVRENVQIAHLTCNTAKGNRGGGEQLLLIG